MQVSKFTHLRGQYRKTENEICHYNFQVTKQLDKTLRNYLSNAGEICY